MDGSHNFLGQKHTSQYLKEGEILITKLAERGSWETWTDGGRLGMAERAQAEAVRILREHEVPALETAQDQELDALMEAASHELVKDK
jgi:trimethylamine:corrinoid methyltransferase-like protein